MSLVKIQSVTSNATGNSLDLPLSNVAAGDLIVIELSCYQGSKTGAPIAPTDNNGSVNVAVISVRTPVTSGDSIAAGIWYIQNTASGTHTISFAFGANNGDYWGTATEYSGAANIAVLDQTASNTGTTGQTLTSGTTPPLANNNDLAVVAIAVASGAGVANCAITDPPSGYNSLLVRENTSTDIGAEQSYSFLSSSSGQSVTWAWTDATTLGSSAVIATFISAGGGGGGGNSTTWIPRQLLLGVG